MNFIELNNITTNWLASFLNNRDIEALLSLYDNDAKHFSPKLKVWHPETHALIKGKADLHAWWSNVFNRLPALQYEVIRLTPNEDRVFMEYIRHVNDEEDMYNGEMLEVNNGRIVKLSVFHR